MKLQVLTNSRGKCFRRCAREHLLSYELGYRPVLKSDALRFGDLFHVGLEAWWREPNDALRLAAAVEAMAPRAADDFEFVRAGVLMQGYDLRWGADAEHYEVIGVELQFGVPLVNPETGAASRTFTLAGKLDVLVRDKRNGLVKLVEHKTTSDDIGVGSDYWQRLMMDSQISTYFAGAKSAGFDVAECIYDVIKKPALRPGSVPLTDELGSKIVLDASGERVRTLKGKWRETGDTAQGYVLQTRPETAEEFRARLVEHVAENPERYYQRGPVVRLQSEEQDAAYDAWQTARNIRDAQLAKRWPKNPDNCLRPGWRCDFFAVCSGTASLDDTSLFRKLEDVHEELSFEAA